jgi:hypothetical protein
VLIAVSDTGISRLIDNHLPEGGVANALSRLKRKMLVSFYEKHALNPSQDKSGIVTGEVSVTLKEPSGIVDKAESAHSSLNIATSQSEYCHSLYV